MRIVKFSAENFKGVKAVEIVPDASNPLVVISGKNGAGKSSVLDAIWGALQAADMKSGSGVVDPVREGEDKATSTLDLGDIVVTRTWKKDGTNKLEVVGKDGSGLKSPQTVLDSYMSKVSFDPLAFTRMSAAKQQELFAKVIGIADQVNAVDAEIKRVYERRTATGQKLTGFPICPVTEGPTEEVDAAQIVKELSVAEAEQHRRTDIDMKQIEASRKASSISATISELLLKIEDLQSEKKALEAQVASYAEERKGWAEIDINSIKDRLSKLSTTNAERRARADTLANNARHEELKAAYDADTATIEKLREDKQSLIVNAKFPVAGVAMGDDGLTYNGKPFGNASSAEQLRVSVAMAMTMNPNIRVIRIADGSLLDSDSKKALFDMASGSDFQIWIEQVDESGKVGIYIEDGEVKSIAGEQTEEKGE